ncbi:MAG TPA: hypothetical protein VFL93_09435 [Longimicrobiaceae bacterium]|nr:hypothetical protein [Longimicrobiaceae bacterium]
MSDSPSFHASGSASLPPASIYDPLDDEGTPFAGELTRTIVLLLVGAADRRWAARTAVELSTVWARHGRRVVLADLHLENPVLHEAARSENLEGIVDVFLYGASVARSARAVEGRGFFLVPAGTYEPDAEAIYRHPRWPKLVAGFEDADASLVLFAPADGFDAQAMAQWVGEVILLGTPADLQVLEPLRAAGVPIRGRIAPPSEEPVSREPMLVPAPPPAPPPEAPPPEAPPPPPDLDLPPVAPPRENGSGAASTWLLWLVFALVVIAAIGYVVASVRPDLIPWARRPAAQVGRPAATVVPRPAVVPPAPPPPHAVGVTLPYSVQVVSFRQFGPAHRRVETYARRFPDVPFFVSPEDESGILYYKVLAGTLEDTVAAHALRERLTRAGVISKADAARGWSLIRHVPLAYVLGERAGDSAATAVSDSLLARKLPVYTLPVLYSDSSRRWEILAGAYADSTSAGAMRKLLDTAGLQASLAPRTGNPAPAAK